MSEFKVGDEVVHCEYKDLGPGVVSEISINQERALVKWPEITGVCDEAQSNLRYANPAKSIASDLKATLKSFEGINSVGGDPINSPAHYTAYPVEVIELTECLNFNRGNAVKYIARAGLKSPDTEIQDLKKARWYIDREIKRMKASS